MELWFESRIEPQCSSKVATSKGAGRKSRGGEVRKDLLSLAYAVVERSRGWQHEQSAQNQTPAAMSRQRVLKRVQQVLDKHGLAHVAVDFLEDGCGKGGSVRETGSASNAASRKLCLNVALGIFQKGNAEEKLESFVAHEICTHALRASADWKTPWCVNREAYGMGPVKSRELASTEEGLATLNGLLFYPSDPAKRFLLSPALLYVSAAEAQGRTFAELFDVLERAVPNPTERFWYCVRAKRDTPRGGREANGRGQIYFEGCVAVLAAVRNVLLLASGGDRLPRTAPAGLKPAKAQPGSGSDGRDSGGVSGADRLAGMNVEALCALYAGRVSLSELSTVVGLMRTTPSSFPFRSSACQSLSLPVLGAGNARRSSREGEAPGGALPLLSSAPGHQTSSSTPVLRADGSQKKKSHSVNSLGGSEHRSSGKEDAKPSERERRRGIVLPEFVAKDPLGYLLQLAHIGVLNGILPSN